MDIENRQPVSQAEVLHRSTFNVQRSTCDSLGRCLLTGLQGEYVIVVSKGGYSPESVASRAISDTSDTVLLLIELWPSQRRRISGQVTEAISGEPVAGARVELITSRQITLSEAQGNFSIDNAPLGRHRLEASALGYRSRSKLVSAPVRAGDTVRIELYDEGLVSIEGEVTDERLMPLAARLWVTGESESMPRDSVDTEHDGTYVFANLPEGVYTLWVESPGYEPESTAAPVVEGWTLKEDFRLRPVLQPQSQEQNATAYVSADSTQHSPPVPRIPHVVSGPERASFELVRVGVGVVSLRPSPSGPTLLRDLRVELGSVALGKELQSGLVLWAGFGLCNWTDDGGTRDQHPGLLPVYLCLSKDINHGLVCGQVTGSVSGSIDARIGVKSPGLCRSLLLPGVELIWAHDFSRTERFSRVTLSTSLGLGRRR